MRDAPGLAPWTGPTERVGQLLMLDARGEDLSFVNRRPSTTAASPRASRSARR
jgi:hypothetical protein